MKSRKYWLTTFANIKSTISASYSAWLLLVLYLKIRASSTTTPFSPYKTMFAPPHFLSKEPSKLRCHSWGGTSCTNVTLAAKSARCYPLMEPRSSYQWPNSKSSIDQETILPAKWSFLRTLATGWSVMTTTSHPMQIQCA